MTEKGIGIIGIEASLDDTKTLVILPDNSLLVDKIVFTAKCSWVNKDSEGRSAYA